MITFSLFSATSAFAGGSSGNGGGGLYSSGQLGWISVGAPGPIEVESYEDQIRELKRTHPSVRSYALCPKSEPDLLVPRTKLAAYFDIRIKQQDGRVRSLGQSDICDSPELIASLGRFHKTLTEAELEDPFTWDLLHRAYTKGGKIPLVITDHYFELPTRTGQKTVDSSAYDPRSGQIFWHSAASVKMKGGSLAAQAGLILGQRNPIALLRHEVMHVLLHRVLGSKYPTHGPSHYGRRPVTEDCSACEGAGTMQCQCERVGDTNDTYLHWVTDYQNALIEGICDWAEGSWAGIAHPYNVFGSMIYAFASDFGQSRGRACYLILDESPIDFGSLTSNEAHINTALRELTIDRVLNKKDNILEANKNPAKVKALLDAIETAPINLPQLAYAFDTIRKGDEALRWMRKHFAFDYRDTVTLRSRLSRVQSKDSDVQETCLSPEDSRQWFPEFFSKTKR